MKTKKILAQLDSFFPLGRHRQKARRTKLEKLLGKLSERETALHESLASETRKRQCKQLQNELTIINEQREKAKMVLKSCQADSDSEQD